MRASSSAEAQELVREVERGVTAERRLRDAQKSKNTDALLGALDEMVELAPFSVEALSERAKLFIEAKKYEKAVSDLQ